MDESTNYSDYDSNSNSNKNKDFAGTAGAGAAAGVGDKLTDLIKGEISAIETYEQVRNKIDKYPEATNLYQIQDDHIQAANLLKQHARLKHMEVPDQSGAWGAWAKTVTGAAKIFGNKTALKALKEGEEHGIKLYQDALNDPALDDGLRNLIRTDLLPRQRKHISIIDNLM